MCAHSEHLVLWTPFKMLNYAKDQNREIWRPMSPVFTRNVLPLGTPQNCVCVLHWCLSSLFSGITPTPAEGDKNAPAFSHDWERGTFFGPKVRVFFFNNGGITNVLNIYFTTMKWGKQDHNSRGKVVWKEPVSATSKNEWLNTGPDLWNSRALHRAYGSVSSITHRKTSFKTHGEARTNFHRCWSTSSHCFWAQN